MEIKVTVKRKTLTVGLCGELDHHTAKEVRDLIENMIKNSQIKNLVFDFSDLSFMDSSGIGMIMGRYKKIRTLGGKVAAFGVNAQILRIMEMSGIDKIIKLTPNYDRALILFDK